MTHAATQAEVEQALERAELMIGDPRIDVKWMAARINKLVEALENIRERRITTMSASAMVDALDDIGDLADHALSDYYGTKE